MKKVGIEDFGRWKREGRRFACLTAYDAPTARILTRSGIPLILVGDSVGNVVLGYRDTVPVTLEEMLHHTRAVRRGAADAFVVADMPFLSYQISPDEAIRSAGRLIKEGAADAVKLEGGAPMAATVRRLVDVGIPVMGHLGLTPQSSTALGGMRVQGTTAESASRIVVDARQLEAAGAFSMVLECVPSEVAQRVTESISIPTVGIGAGPECDGQILVLHDLLGFESGYQPRFVRRYAAVENVIADAVERYRQDVSDRNYPSRDESFWLTEEEKERLRSEGWGEAGGDEMGREPGGEPHR